MTLLFKIILGCLIAIVIVICLAVVGFILFFRHLSKFDDNLANPLAIHLHKDLAAKWIEEKQAVALIAEFKKIGFTQGDAYTVEQMDKVKMLSLFNNQYVGVIYVIESMGYFFDIMHQSANGDYLTVTTMPFAEDFEPTPGKEKILLEKTTVANAFTLLQERCDKTDSNKLTNETFRNCVEQYYKDEQAYRNRNGGMSFDEFNNVAKKHKQKISEKDLREAFIELKEEELNLWNDAAAEEYFRDSNIDEDDQYDFCYFLVPKKTDTEAFLHYLSYFNLVNEDHIETIVEKIRNDEKASYSKSIIR